MIHFDHELDDLKQKLLTMAAHAEKAVANALKALTERDDELALRVKEEDKIIDQFEMDIDELAIQLLSKAPLATQLRLITVAMKTSRDLERVGDEATTIARRALELNRGPQLKPYVDLPAMAELALGMLRDALHSFVSSDPARARAVIPRDKQVDALNKQVHHELAQLMAENPNTIARCLHLMVISKCLERIADHAKNIAEEAVYLQEGRDIRHGHEPPAPPAAAGT